MARIKLLPPTVIHQIAAGEVADRPAHIIKELIENALDAEANQIKIEVDLSGQTKIIVSDNGLGMSPEDLQLAPLRHTTSKISRFEDLLNLDSFGFRGEALAAIAYASRLTLMSRLPNETVGYAVTVENDQVSTPRSVGMPTGSVIIIENLFEKMPARHKFLKKPATELKLIMEIISAAALSQPTVGFIFEYQHKRLISLPTHQDLITRSLELYRLGSKENVIEIEVGTSPFALKGWIAKPNFTSYAKHKQIWIVNHRPVHQTELNQVVKNSYGSLLEPRVEPSFVLDLEVPASSIDVNAHPQKQSLNFSQTEEIFQLIANAVTNALSSTDVTYSLSPSFKGRPLLEKPLEPRRFSAASVTKNLAHFQDTINTSWQPGSSPDEEKILQLGRTYLLFETSTGLHLVDQHAAHERILFESFLTQLTHKPATLTPALVIHPTPVEKKTFELQKNQLLKLGFEAEDFGQDILKLTQVPSILTHQSPSEIADLFLQILDEMTTMPHSIAWEEQQRIVLASLACHSAVRAGDYLTPIQRQELLSKLEQVPNSATCPHGRPTTIRVSFKELAQLFKRLK